MLRDRPLANENRQSCLRQEQGAMFLYEGTLFLPVVACQAIALSKIEGPVEWATADLPTGKKLLPSVISVPLW